MTQVAELRSITLRPGTRVQFQRLYVVEALPLLRRWDFDVLAHGPSLHDEVSYYVIRRYDSLGQRERMEDAYYGSDDWRQGPRQVVLALIENYVDVVFEVPQMAVDGLRKQPNGPERTEIDGKSSNNIIEIRTFTLKPGERDNFRRLYSDMAVPLLRRWSVDVLQHGPSLHDEDSYYTIRRYDSLAQRKLSQAAFYAREAWRNGLREAMLALVEKFVDVVLKLDEVGVEGLRVQRPET